MTVFLLLVEVYQKLRMQIICIMGCPDFGLMMFYVLIYTSHHPELMKVMMVWHFVIISLSLSHLTALISCLNLPIVAPEIPMHNFRHPSWIENGKEDDTKHQKLCNGSKEFNNQPTNYTQMMNFLPRMQQHFQRFKETGSCNCITFKLQHYNMHWVRWNSHLTNLLQRKKCFVLGWDKLASNMVVAKK